MKKILCSVLPIAVMISLAGCNRKNQFAADLTQAAGSSTKSSEIIESTDDETTYIETTDIQTEEIFLPTDDIDLLAVSDEYLSAYSSLYHKYLQSD